VRQTLRVSVLTGILLTFSLAFQNCSKVNFASEVNPSGLNAVNGTDAGDDHSCHIDLVSSTKPIKILFLIDTSGSNASNNGGPGTDKDKVWRLATINNFLSVYGSKSNFQFGFATFQEASAKALITSGGHGVFTSDSAKINQAITDFKNTPDDGYTPYDAALDVVQDMISYDQQVNPSKEMGYVLVMVSDGTPTNASYVSANGMQNLSSDVNDIMAIAPKQISLNTVFLYNDSIPSASQKSYLQKIASIGAGAFIEASSQDTLKISDTIQAPEMICQ
jgi:uncharacterized protein YegL